MKKSSSEAVSPGAAGGGGAGGGRPRWQRWKRRLKIAAGVVVVLILVFRLSLNFLMPTVMRSIAHRYGLMCKYDKMELSLTGGDVGIWGLKLTPLAGGNPLISADYLRGKIYPWALLAGHLRVERAEADAAEVLIEREVSGRIPILESFTSPSPSKAPLSPSAGAIDLTSPLMIHALRVQQLKAHVVDHVVVPQVDVQMVLDVRVSYLGEPQPTQFEAILSADKLVDQLHLAGAATTTARMIDANFELLVNGLRLKPAAGYIAAWGIQPSADEVSARLTGKLHAVPLAGSATGITGTLTLENSSITADRSEAFDLEKLVLDIADLDFQHATLSKVTINGLRAKAGRSAAGRFRFAGFDFVKPVLAPGAMAPPAKGGGRTAVARPFLVALREFSIRSLHAAFEDQAVNPPAQLVLNVDDFSANDLTGKPLGPDTTITIAGNGNAPGLLKGFHLEGTFHPLGDIKRLELALEAKGIKPEVLRAYLAGAGLESEFQDGSFTARLDAVLNTTVAGRLGADAHLSELKLQDAGTDLLALGNVRLAGVTFDMATGATHADAVEISGPTMVLRREASGALSALGLRTKVVGGAAASAPAAATGPGISIPGSARRGARAGGPFVVPHLALPTVDIGHFVWKGVKIQLDDQAAAVPTVIAITDAGLDIKDFRVAETAQAAAAKPGTMHAWLAAPGLVGTVTVDGQLRPSTHGFSADVEVAGDALNASPLATYLRPLGFEPTLQAGTLHGKATVSVADMADGLHASVTAREVRYADGAAELAAVDGFELQGVLTPGQVTVEKLHLDHPRAALSRDADGSLRAGGLHLLARAAAATPAPAGVAVPTAVVAGGAVARPGEAEAAGAEPTVLFLKDCVIDHASLAWSDRAAGLPVQTTATVQGEVHNLTLGRDVGPATVALTVGVADTVAEATLSGQLLLTPATQGAQLQIAASGIRSGVLPAYLPAGVAVGLRDGTAKMGIDALWTKNAEGGNQGHCNFSNMIISEGGGGAGAVGGPLLSLDRAEIAVSRFDLAHKMISLDHITTAGLRGSVRRSTDGALHVGGIVLGGARATEAGAAEKDVQAGGAVALAPAAPATPAAFVAGGAGNLPLVHIGNVDLQLAQLSFTDEARPADAAPVVLEGFRLRTLAPIDCLGRDAATLPSIKLELTGKVAPVLEEIKATAKLGLFARDPYADLVVSVRGLHGAGLVAVVPELKEKVDAAGLTDGLFTAHVNGKIHLDRRSPVDFDLSQPFTAQLLADQIAYRAVPGGPVLLGLDEVRADEIHVTPAEKVIEVRSVEVTKPTLQITQESDGLHVLGMVVKLPAHGATADPDTEPAAGTEPVRASGADTGTVGPAVAVPAASGGPVGEIVVRKLVVSGLDARFEDDTAVPPLVIPLNGMEFEAHGLSSRALVEARPIRYNLLLNAGPVSLLETPEAVLVPGAPIAAATSMPAATEAASTEHAATQPASRAAPAARTRETQDLFAQITSAGRLSLYPKPKGWAKTSVTGLELAALRGSANKYGVTLTRGLFDSTVTARFRDDGTAKLNLRLVFTDLSLAEHEGGPLAKFFKLPAPIDVAIGAVQDPDGSITIPLELSLHSGQISQGELVGAAIGAMSNVLVVAIASAPVKAVEGMGALLGMKATRKPTKLPDVVLAFGAGSSAYDPQSVAQVEQLIRDLQKDTHLSIVVKQELGQDDLLRIKARANPSVDEARVIVAELRRKRAELTHLQSEVAGEARGELAARVDPAVVQATLARLAAIDRELAQTDDALDTTSELLRPGADRQANRRTRAAALQLAKERVSVIRDALKQANLPDASTRVTIPTAGFTLGTGATGRIVLSVTRQR